MSTFILTCRNIFLAKIPFYLITIILLLSVVSLYYIGPFTSGVASASVIETAQNAGCISNMNIIRLKDYELIKPVLLADINRESNELEETKGSIIDIIHQQQQYGNVGAVSVYLRKFSDGSWCTINGEEQYDPGSLMKLPILIAILKQAETTPSLLDKLILFGERAKNMPTQNFIEDSLIPGTKYKVRELLARMIVNSDNDAVTLLNQDLNVPTLKKLFSDLNLREPFAEQKNYLITASDCAKFFRILYNSSYLNHDLSEFALDLLTQSKFNKGLIKNIPTNTKVAHKFGESGITGSDVQLSEGGIIYLDNNPYLLVVMTKGKDFGKMSECISNISDVVYSKFSGRALN